MEDPRSVEMAEDSLADDLGRRLKAARALSGKKVRDVASAAGISNQKLYRLERGEQVPDALELVALARATHSSVDFLLGLASSQETESGGTLEPERRIVNSDVGATRA